MTFGAPTGLSHLVGDHHSIRRMSKRRRRAVEQAACRRYTDLMSGSGVCAIVLVLVSIGTFDAQTKPPAPARKAPARKTPAPPPAPITRIQADLQCPSELGLGVKTKRRFCDVLTGRDPKAGILVDDSTAPRAGDAVVRAAQPAHLFGGAGQGEEGVPAVHRDGRRLDDGQHVDRSRHHPERFPFGDRPIRSHRGRRGSRAA